MSIIVQRKAFHLKKTAIQIDKNCLDCGLCYNGLSNGCAHVSSAPLLNKSLMILFISVRDMKKCIYIVKKFRFRQYVTTVTVSCLGLIPREAWVTMLKNCKNLFFLHPDGGCNSCEFHEVKRFGEEVASGERIVGHTISMTSTILSYPSRTRKSTIKGDVILSIVSKRI